MDCGRVRSAIFRTQRSRWGLVDSGADTSRDNVGVLIDKCRGSGLGLPAVAPRAGVGARAGPGTAGEPQYCRKPQSTNAFYRVAKQSPASREAPAGLAASA